MTLVTTALLLLGGYLGVRWFEARAENVRLAAEIVHLKRRLAGRRPA